MTTFLMFCIITILVLCSDYVHKYFPHKHYNIFSLVFLTAVASLPLWMVIDCVIQGVYK